MQKKIETKNFELTTVHDTNQVMVDMFEGKITKIIKKLPRSHVIMLQMICEIISDSGQLAEMGS